MVCVGGGGSNITVDRTTCVADDHYVLFRWGMG